MDDTDFSNSSYPMPIANVGRRKRLFSVPEDAMEDIDFSTPNDESYAKYLSNAPQRENYQAGTGRRIMSALVAGLSAAGGENVGRSIGIGQSIQDDPYNKATSDWKLRGAGMEKLAEIEGRRINTQMHVADYRNKFNIDVGQMEQAKDNAEATAHNADLTRQETGRRNDEIARHNFTTEGQTSTNQTEANKIRNRQVDAYNERTKKIESRGSQVSHQISMLNKQKAHDEAVSEILLEQPKLAKYFDLDPKSGLIIRLKQNDLGLNVKDDTEPGMIYGRNSVQSPLDVEDRKILNNFLVKLKDRMVHKLSLNMGNIQDMQANEFEFQDESSDVMNPEVPDLESARP